MRKQKFYFRKHIAPPSVEGQQQQQQQEENSDESPVKTAERKTDAHFGESAKCWESLCSKVSLHGIDPVVCSKTFFLTLVVVGSLLSVIGSQHMLSKEDMFEEMTMEEIFLGKDDYYPGLLPLIYAYLDYINCDAATMKRVEEYLEFIRRYRTARRLPRVTLVEKQSFTSILIWFSLPTGELQVNC